MLSTNRCHFNIFQCGLFYFHHTTITYVASSTVLNWNDQMEILVMLLIIGRKLAAFSCCKCLELHAYIYDFYQEYSWDILRIFVVAMFFWGRILLLSSPGWAGTINSSFSTSQILYLWHASPCLALLFFFIIK